MAKTSFAAAKSAREAKNRSFVLKLSSYDWTSDDSLVWPANKKFIAAKDARKRNKMFTKESLRKAMYNGNPIAFANVQIKLKHEQGLNCENDHRTSQKAQ